MRGNYHTGHEERRRFFNELNRLCRYDTDRIDLVGTQLSLRDCQKLIEELGYTSGDWDFDGEEIWIHFYQEYYPKLTVKSDGYIVGLTMYYDMDADDVDKEKIRELMRKYWGKYFPVI